ncbi:MAG: CS1-pili formation C-terminal domain-containing protein [Pseudomonadales bacterium]|nr:CS1-pili formation C-terminal domain-containing protein [Pseudomonadales bacterium]
MHYFVTILLMLVSLGAVAQTGNESPASPAPSKGEFLRAILGTPAPDKDRYIEALRNAPRPETHTVVVSSKPAASKKKKKAAFVPPGFEQLLQPQTTFVDVYYGGAFLLSTTATFTPTEISFQSPAEITAKIPDILEPAQVEARLGESLATNSEFACLRANETDCGHIDTDSVDVIFDEGKFRVDLFIAPSLLSVRPAAIAKFLPPSSAGLSLLNVTSATMNGEEGRDENYNIGNSTTLAYKETRLFAQSNITRAEDFTIDTLALQREYRGRQYQAGYFRSNAGNLLFIGQTDFAGVNISSSLDTRQDLDQSSGNDLQVFLESRSRVDIIKDGRLISTAVYETGNQIIDTSNLPGGAYEVTLRIRDSFGGEREETRFYVKTNDLPPLDQTLYFVDVGESVTRETGDVLPTGTGEKIFRAGISKRLSRDFGGDIGVLAEDNQYLAEGGFFRLGRSWDLRLNYAVGSLGSRGLGLNARTRLGPVTLNATGRRTWSDDPTAIVGPEATQGSINLTVPLGRTSLSLSSRYNKRDAGTDENYGLRLDFPTYNFGNRILDSSLQIADNNGDTLILFGVRFALRSEHWQNQVSARAYRETNEMGRTSGVITNLTSNWQDGDRFLSDVNVTLRANDEQQDRTFESELDIVGSLGRANFDALYSTEADRLSYGASLFTTVIANRDSVSLGGRNQARSAVVLDIDGDTKDAWFDVKVNNQARGNARIGTKTVVGLAPFQTYEVSLAPRGKSIVDFNNQTRTTTLYPGNVVTLHWAVTRVLVAFGQIVDTDGNPVKNALIEGVLGLATTDEFGMFQAEINSDTESLKVRTRESECRVSLPDYDTTQLVVTLDTLVCR